MVEADNALLSLLSLLEGVGVRMIIPSEAQCVCPSMEKGTDTCSSDGCFGFSSVENLAPLEPHSCVLALSLHYSSFDFRSCECRSACTSSKTWRSHQTWMLALDVNSGWKLVPNTFRCLTATMSPISSFSPIAPTFSTSLLLRPGSVAIISTDQALAISSLPGAITVSSRSASSFCSPATDGRILSTTGARMKMPLKGAVSAEGASFKNGRSRSASKLSVCLPK